MKSHYGMTIFNKTIQQNTSSKLDFQWPWTVPEDLRIPLFSLIDIDGETRPDWVDINASVSITLNRTPIVSEITIYKFGLQTSYNSRTSVKKFYITVEPCLIQNWNSWVLKNHTFWETCEEGYEAINDGEICRKIDKAKGEVIAAQTLLVTTTVLTSISTITGGGSLSGCFNLLNQFQLYIILPLVGRDMPKTLINFIMGTDFALFSFDFISLRNLTGVSYIFDYIDRNQTDEYLYKIGIKSESSLVNHFNLFMLILSVFILHLIFECLKFWSKSWIKKKKVKKNWLVISKFFNFSVYIRIILESILFLFLSIFSELRNAKTSKISEKVSILISGILSTMACLFITVWIYQSLKFDLKKNKGKSNKYQEFFRGLKEKWIWRPNTLLFILTRLLSVILLIIFSYISKGSKIGALFIIHFSEFLYILIVRPFKYAKDNIIEILYKLTFQIAIIMLFFLNDNNEWLYIQILLSGPIAGSIVSIISIINQMCAKLQMKSKTKISVKKRKEEFKFDDLQQPKVEKNQKEDWGFKNKRNKSMASSSMVWVGRRPYYRD